MSDFRRTHSRGGKRGWEKLVGARRSPAAAKAGTEK